MGLRKGNVSRDERAIGRKPKKRDEILAISRAGKKQLKIWEKIGKLKKIGEKEWKWRIDYGERRIEYRRAE